MKNGKRRWSEESYDNYEGYPLVEDFSPEWANAILDDMENANWHEPRAAFESLIELLPSIYAKADKPLQRKLKNAIRSWDHYF